MIKGGLRKVKTVSFLVQVKEQDIVEGECLDPNKCMIRVAVERTLRELDPTMPNHHTRVDAGHIRFNYEGRRCAADTPRIAKASLIQFDSELADRRQACKSGEKFKTKVVPFSFKVCAEVGDLLEATTAERKKQINEARHRREEAGRKDKQYTLRKRVVGFA